MLLSRIKTALWSHRTMVNSNNRDARPGINMPVGSRHYRAFVGMAERYDTMAAMQFILLTGLGLREYHSLLDIGCGSLRAGRIFIPYLLPGQYYGIEPETWLVKEGVKNEIGRDQIRIKRPTFSNDPAFTLSIFSRTFDYLIAHSIFTHSPRNLITRCLSEARKVMHPSSKFLASYFLGTTDYTGTEWVYPDSCPYTEQGIIELIRGEGLQCTTLDYPDPICQKWLLTENKYPLWQRWLLIENPLS